jgi:hypothetical protein
MHVYYTIDNIVKANHGGHYAAMAHKHCKGCVVTIWYTTTIVTIPGGRLDNLKVVYRKGI